MLGYSAKIHATPSERDLNIKIKEASRRAWKDEYDRDIARREERAGKLRAIERAQDILRVKESKIYSPWGRGGGGAGRSAGPHETRHETGSDADGWASAVATRGRP